MIKEENRRLFFKISVVIIFFLLCGIGYRIGGFDTGSPGDRDTEVLLLEEERAQGEETQGEEASPSSEVLPPEPSADGSGEGEASSAGVSSRESYLYVYLCGAVRHPGVYRLQTGDRVTDAVAMAGGFGPEAAEEFVNLARLLQDGERIYIPTREETNDRSPLEGVGDVFLPEGPEALTGKVNLNTATREELKTLSGIGDARALEIIRWRESNGSFSRIEDIMKVPGIKEGAFEKIKDSIEVR